MSTLFWQCFGTGMKWISIVVLTIFTLVLLGNWWTDLSFPYFLFDWDADDRKCIFWTSVALTVLCTLFSWVQADGIKEKQAHNKLMDSLTPEQRTEYYDTMIAYYRNRSKVPARRATSTRKSPDVVDIALGVATGAVIGEVINDFLED